MLAFAEVETARDLQALFDTARFRVYVNHDVVGVEAGGALKNVIAIATGMSDGAGGGDNTRAAIITRGLAEVTRLGVAMGAEAQTFAGLAGVGDLVATCTSTHSRNHFVGEGLGRGRTLDEILAEMTQVAEGVKSAPVVLELAAEHDVPAPICSGTRGRGEGSSVHCSGRLPIMSSAMLLVRSSRSTPTDFGHLGRILTMCSRNLISGEPYAWVREHPEGHRVRACPR